MSAVPRSSPIQIGRNGNRTRRDTIDAIKNSSLSFPGQSEKLVPGLGASTPPSFVPDGSYKHTRIDQYDILEQVEGHNSGNVYKAVNIHNEKEFICKVYDRKEYGKTMSVYGRVSDHQNINQIADKVILQTEVYAFYYPGQPMNGPSTGFKADNLHNFIRSKARLTEEEAAPLFRQVVAAVAHCHKNNVVVKDLKLRKFIFRDKERKQVMLECVDDAHVLEDGDNDKISEDGKAFPAYVSPEMIVYLKNSKSKDAEFNGKSRDVWRLGVMLYTMLVGCYPFKVEDNVLTKIFHCQYSIPSNVSSEAKDLIRRLLRRSPNERIAAEDIEYHPWIKYNGKFSKIPVQALGRGGDSHVVDGVALADLQRFPLSSSLPASLYSAPFYSDQVVPDFDADQQVPAVAWGGDGVGKGHWSWSSCAELHRLAGIAAAPRRRQQPMINQPHHDENNSNLRTNRLSPSRSIIY